MNQLPIFVYGTLLPGQPNYVLWEQSILSLEPASIPNAALLDMGWYPMLVDSLGSRVWGLVVRVRPESYAQVISRLDFLEGYDPAAADSSEYRREKRVVTLTGGSPLVAWVYAGYPEVMEARRIETNWIAHVRSQRWKLADWWKDVRTVGRW